MRKRIPLSERLFDTFNTILLSALAFICLYPMLYVIFASVSDPVLFMKHKGFLMWPLGFVLKGYELIFKNPNSNIFNGFINTVYYTSAGTVVNLIMTCIGAYVLSRKEVLWNKFFMAMITFTMFFGGGLIPSYLLVKDLGMMNSAAALIIPGAINTFNLFIMRTAFADVPESLIESARLDGANDFTILFRVVIPLSKAILAVISLFYIVAHWNEWFGASIFLQDRNKYPIQLILREILINNDTSSMLSFGSGVNYSNGYNYQMLVQYCTIVIATVPILAVYPLMQKYFVKGVMIGSIKE